MIFGWLDGAFRLFSAQGFGFVCFSSPDEATKAVTEMHLKARRKTSGDLSQGVYMYVCMYVCIYIYIITLFIFQKKKDDT